MSEPVENTLIGPTQAKRLAWEYREMCDIVECQVLAMWMALDVVEADPGSISKLKQQSENSRALIHRQLTAFGKLLEAELHLPATTNEQTSEPAPAGNPRQSPRAIPGTTGAGT